MEESPSVEFVSRYIAGVQQKYTQSGGVRPFGITTLIVGFENTGEPRLFQTDPSGTYSAWKATATGRNAKNVREYLEKNYTDEGDDATLKLATRAILEVVEAGSKNIEIAIMRRGKPLEMLDDSAVDELVTTLEAEKAAEEEKKQGSAPK